MSVRGVWTYELAMAASRDAANMQMRKAGRTAWNVEDQHLAVDTFNRLFPLEAELRARAEGGSG